MTIQQYIKVAFLWLLYLPIVFITCLIVWVDRKVKFPLFFPRDVAGLAVKQEWCISELKKSGALPADAAILGYRVWALNPEIIFRSNAGVIEIRYRDKAEEKTLKCFAKFAPTMGSVWNKVIFNLQLNHIKEGNFNQYFVRVDPAIPSPRVYYSCFSLLGHLCLITELMEGYIEYDLQPIPQAHLDMALDGLAALHARYWGNSSKQMAKVMPIEDSTVHLFESMVLLKWSKNARKVLVQSWTYMNGRQTVIHGDARIGNMMFPPVAGQGRFVFIDWQAVRRGKAMADVSYFLMLSLPPERLMEVEQACIDAYYDKLAGKGVTGYSRTEARDDYNHGCLCTLVLLSLPLLSGEVSAEGDAARIFVWGMGIWRDRMVSKFSSFDYDWMAEKYGMSPQAAQGAVNEMLEVIGGRLQKMADDSLEETNKKGE
jgi:hypothetical protein